MDGEDMWLGSYNSYLVRLDSTHTLFTSEEAGTPNHRGKPIGIDGQGYLWVGTLDGPVVFDGTGWANMAKDSALQAQVMGIGFSTNGDVWISNQMGVHTLSQGRWSHFSEVDGIWDAQALTISVDKSQRVWLGTHSGLSYWDGTLWKNILPK